MEEFLMSSNREGSYNGTFSINSKNNSQCQKEIMKSNEASAKNIEICSTSKFDAQFLNHEIQNIKRKAQQDSTNQNNMNCKLKENIHYEIKDLTDIEDSNSQRNIDEEDIQFKNNVKVYDFNSQIDLSSSDLRKEVNKNVVYNLSSSFLQQQFSSQLKNIVMNQQNNQHIPPHNRQNLQNTQQILSKNQQNLQTQISKKPELIKGDFSLDQNHDVAFDEMLLGQGDSEQQFDDEGDLKDDNSNLQNQGFQKQVQQYKQNSLKMNSEKDINQKEGKKSFLQQQKLSNQFQSDPNFIINTNNNDKRNSFKSQGNQQISILSENQKVYKQKQNFTSSINNYLTSEQSNSDISNYNLTQKSKSLQQQDIMKDKIQSQKYNQEHKDLYRQMNDKKGEEFDEIGEYEDDRLDCQDVQFVTLQNDLGDSMQKKSEFNQYFNINNSQGSESNKYRDQFQFTNQSAHFSTMNPSYLENFQQLCQKSKDDKIRTDDNSDVNNIEQIFDTNSSICAPNRLYNVQQTSELSDRSSPRIEQQSDFNQIVLQERFQFDQNSNNEFRYLENINKNSNQQINQDKKKKLNSRQSSMNQNCKENEYKTIDIDQEKKSQKSTINQGDQEIMQKLYKKNQELTFQNNNLYNENQQLKQELETMKSDLLKKYENIRKNNENLFKSFEEQSNLMLKKQKEKSDEKILKLQLQLREYESQNINKKDNFRDRNNQLYEMVLKLEKEKQELHDKNLQLIKKQINHKSEKHKNGQDSCINTTIDLIDGDINKSQIQKYKMSIDDSSIHVDNNFNSTLNNYNSFSSQLVSPNSYSIQQNQYKSKSIDFPRFQQQIDYNLQDKSNHQNISQQESQFQDFKTQAEKVILEKRYDDLFSKYKTILSENNELRKNQSIMNDKCSGFDKNIDQSSNISPPISAAEARLNNYLIQQNNKVSSQTNSSYYQPSINSKDATIKPYHKTSSSIPCFIDNNSMNTSMLIKEITPSYQVNQKTNNIKTLNYSQMYDPFNTSYVDEKDILNQSKANHSLNNILPHQSYQTEQQSNQSQTQWKKNSLHLNYINPKYFNYDTNKENNINKNNQFATIDQYSDQNPCSLVRMNNYVLSRKYNDKEDEDKKEKRKSQSKQKDGKKKKQNLNKSTLDISIVKDKMTGTDGHENKYSNNKQNSNKQNIQNNILQNEKIKKNRSNSVAKTTMTTTKTTINYEKDNFNLEKSFSKGNNINSNKNEVKRSNSNSRGTKILIFSKVKI